MKRAANTEPLSPEAFRRALEAIGWQQTDFAERTGMHPQTVNRWATGKAPAAPWATAYLEAMLDLAALRDKYLTPGRRLGDLVASSEPQAMGETAHLLSTPANAAHLAESVAQFKAKRSEPPDA